MYKGILPVLTFLIVPIVFGASFYGTAVVGESFIDFKRPCPLAPIDDYKRRHSRIR